MRSAVEPRLLVRIGELRYCSRGLVIYDETAWLGAPISAACSATACSLKIDDADQKFWNTIRVTAAASDLVELWLLYGHEITYAEGDADPLWHGHLQDLTWRRGTVSMTASAEPLVHFPRHRITADNGFGHLPDHGARFVTGEGTLVFE